MTSFAYISISPTYRVDVTNISELCLIKIYRVNKAQFGTCIHEVFVPFFTVQLLPTCLKKFSQYLSVVEKHTAIALYCKYDSDVKESRCVALGG